jgi:hypothetical protein
MPLDRARHPPCIILVTHIITQNAKKNSLFHIHLIFFNPLRTKLYLSDLETQFIPPSKHSVSVIKTDKVMLYREIIAVCYEIHRKNINTLCGQKVELLNVTAGGT